MKMSIKEFSALTGVSARTLHYYDEIGLLKPDIVNKDNGYRFYTEKSYEKMLEILFLKELDFSLKDISEIILSPSYNKKEAYSKQKELLILKKERLESLILALEKAEKGELTMDNFNNNEFEKAKDQYAAEVKEKWGNTDAYRESQQKASSMTTDEKQNATDGLNSIMAEFSTALKDGHSPESAETQALCQKLQSHITENFYTCTKEILKGLGEMYVLDERFKENIDKSGEGTAEFIRSAIRIYCN